VLDRCKKFVIELQIVFIQNFHVKTCISVYSFKTVGYRKYLFTKILWLFYEHSYSFNVFKQNVN